MRRGRTQLRLLSVALPLVTGCGTVASLVIGGSGIPTPPGTRLWPLGAVYCGVAMDLELIRRGTPSGRFLAMLDVPLSLTLDTLLLPLTGAMELSAWWWSRQRDPGAHRERSPDGGAPEQDASGPR